jgi:hypothetical protein
MTSPEFGLRALYDAVDAQLHVMGLVRWLDRPAVTFTRIADW